MTSTPHNPDNSNLLACMQRMLQQQSEASESLLRQHCEAMERLQRQHRAEVQALTAAAYSGVGRTHVLQEQGRGNDVVQLRTDTARTRRRILPPWSASHRGKRLGVGMFLGLLLQIAPSQSAVTHAYEGPTNTAYGTSALASPSGQYNSAFGVAALNADTVGNHNQASGSYALSSNTAGSSNSATGADALKSNTQGNYNTASGESALYSNITGNRNTASGFDALLSNTTGYDNTSMGTDSLHNNTEGYFNTASGAGGLKNNTTGYDNTASGFSALFGNSSGFANTAAGAQSLYSNTTGTFNTAIGLFAGTTSTAANANTTGSDNTFIGYNSGPGVPTELNNATAIGANALVSQSDSIVLGGTGANTQKVGVGTTTPHSALQIAKGFLQLRPITGEPAAAQCATADDAGRLVVRTDGPINLYICNGTSWIEK